MGMTSSQYWAGALLVSLPPIEATIRAVVDINVFLLGALRQLIKHCRELWIEIAM